MGRPKTQLSHSDGCYILAWPAAIPESYADLGCFSPVSKALKHPQLAHPQPQSLCVPVAQGRPSKFSQLSHPLGLVLLFVSESSSALSQLPSAPAPLLIRGDQEELSEPSQDRLPGLAAVCVLLRASACPWETLWVLLCNSFNPSFIHLQVQWAISWKLWAIMLYISNKPSAAPWQSVPSLVHIGAHSNLGQSMRAAPLVVADSPVVHTACRTVPQHFPTHSFQGTISYILSTWHLFNRLKSEQFLLAKQK